MRTFGIQDESFNRVFEWKIICRSHDDRYQKLERLTRTVKTDLRKICPKGITAQNVVTTINEMPAYSTNWMNLSSSSSVPSSWKNVEENVLEPSTPFSKRFLLTFSPLSVTGWTKKYFAQIFQIFTQKSWFWPNEASKDSKILSIVLINILSMPNKHDNYLIVILKQVENDGILSHQPL